jgi:hypothetical protein
VVKGCHETYHFDDVAIQRRSFSPDFKGTNNHDLVSATGAAIAVLEDKPPPAPFSIKDKKAALLMLAHFVGDLHQPLHVGSVYLDASGARVDPDKSGAIDPDTENAGGNFVSDQGINLHTEWDAIPVDLGESAEGDMIREAMTVTKSAEPIENWPAVWAGETLALADAVFYPATFVQDRPRHWVATFQDRQSYLRNQDVTKRRQLAKGGARLAQILNEVWP